MLTITYIVLSIVNANTPVPEWIMVMAFLAAMFEIAWLVIVIIFSLIGAIIDKVQQ